VALKHRRPPVARKIPRGEAVLCLPGLSTTDPAGLSGTGPDSVSTHQQAQCASLSFAAASIFAWAAQLARIEAEVAIGTLLRRVSGAAARQMPRTRNGRPTFVLRGLKALPASW